MAIIADSVAFRSSAEKSETAFEKFILMHYAGARRTRSSMQRFSLCGLRPITFYLTRVAAAATYRTPLSCVSPAIAPGCIYTLEELGLLDPRLREPTRSAWDGLERFH